MLNVSALEECLGGEPYWVAKFIDNYSPFGTGDMVKLGYLPGYFTDCGDGGHTGDSEFIQLTVVYNPGTQHWELVNSWLSEHSCNDDSVACWLTGISGDFETWGAAFEWPAARSKTFPRVYVALGKHANYRTLEGCARGGPLGNDTCPNNYDIGRFRVWESHKIGSGHHPLLDCVGSENPTVRPGAECFWTGSGFFGWSGATSGSSRYSLYLHSIVFQGTQVDATTWWRGSYGE